MFLCQRQKIWTRWSQQEKRVRDAERGGNKRRRGSKAREERKHRKERKKGGKRTKGHEEEIKQGEVGEEEKKEGGEKVGKETTR